ncbi:MAG: gliding motility-associated protein GldE [Prevotellaceae bacterium]|nr:gliding motility-associated protein GldE [Prevotellaceae bacterium]
MYPSDIFSALDNITACPPDTSAVIALVLSLVLLCCSALISGSENAFFSLDPSAIAQLEASEKKADKNVLALLQNSHYLLATILIGNNFVNVTVILLLTTFTNTVLDFSQAPVMGFVFETILISFILLLFGEIMPKIYASKYAKKAALFTAPFISVLSIIFRPLAYLLVKSTSIVDNRLSKHSHSARNISMDDLSQALELTSNEKDEDTGILEGIIKFGNIQVSDIMTPRVDIVDVDLKLNYTELLEVVINSGYSRIPVYSGRRDNIKGVLYIKDLLAHLDKPSTFRWQSLIRQPYYVPESKKIDDLLNEFQENKVHLALVVDEYGGIAGLVTLEDILEEIVGDISDEYDEENSRYTKLDDNKFIFEGKFLLNDFYKMAGIEEGDFVKVTDEVETLAGLMLELKGEMPVQNEKITFGKYDFEITSVDDRRIKEVKLTMNKARKKTDDHE